jgi:hypothetical protein
MTVATVASTTTTTTTTSATTAADFKQYYLGELKKFQERVTGSDYDVWNDEQQASLVPTYKFLLKFLDTNEFRALSDGWSSRNNTGSVTQLNAAVDAITKRFNGGVGRRTTVTKR